MGTDKALITTDGITLVERAVDALTRAGADPVIVVGGNRAAIEALGLRYVDDQWPGEGPLGGIITALRSMVGFSSRKRISEFTSPKPTS